MQRQHWAWGVCFLFEWQSIGRPLRTPSGLSCLCTAAKTMGHRQRKVSLPCVQLGRQTHAGRNVVGTSVRRAPAGREVSGGEAMCEEELGRPQDTQGKRGSAKGRKES